MLRSFAGPMRDEDEVIAKVTVVVDMMAIETTMAWNRTVAALWNLGEDRVETLVRLLSFCAMTLDLDETICIMLLRTVYGWENVERRNRGS